MADPRDVYARLLAHYGPQGWWPAKTRFEIVVGALLMAQTSWRNVEAAIGNLRREGMLDPQALARAHLDLLRALVRPAGLHRTKPRRLKAFAAHLVRTSGGDLDRFFAREPDVVRRELLSLDGIGPETADSILLYASDTPAFVVDAYTVRIGRRVGLFDADGYEDVQRYFESHLPRDVGLYREYHALLVAHGKKVCRPRPRCPVCALRDVCAFASQRSNTGKNRTKQL